MNKEFQFLIYNTTLQSAKTSEPEISKSNICTLNCSLEERFFGFLEK